MAVGKEIKIFLIDGMADGRLAGEIANRTGKALKIPRKMLRGSAAREELSKAGVYFLFGKDAGVADENAVYIGEAEETYIRLMQHQKLDFWTEAVVVVSKDDYLNKAHVKYLESKLYESAKRAKRYLVCNTSAPACPRISESEQSVMVAFIENLKILVNTMGYKVFEPLARTEGPQNNYSIKPARGADARAIMTNEGMVVTKGSQIASSLVPSMSPSLVNLRQRLIDQGIIGKQKDKLVFAKDYLFSSTSTAAAVVMGRNANGRIEWKDQKGRTVRENEEGS
jgi:hypothetical protein